MKRGYDRMAWTVLVSCFLSLGGAGTGKAQNQGALALIMKVIPQVTKKSAQKDWNEAVKGDPLATGDHVRTAKSSLAIIKFRDRSIVRLREQSELTLDGQLLEGKVTKTIQLSKGGFGFEFQKQREEQFRLTSPTSVASIRGTKGKLSGGEGFDTLVVTEGLVRLHNNVSNRDTDVAEGNIGFSNQDGTLSVRQATAEEIADANRLAAGGTSNELKLELRDPQGNKKELKLRYQK
ncbi:MAG TPA: FecR family protein [Bacteroidota bacterium]|jgi:hypothetical protein